MVSVVFRLGLESGLGLGDGFRFVIGFVVVLELGLGPDLKLVSPIESELD